MTQISPNPRRKIHYVCVERPFDFQSPFEGREFVLMLVVNDSTVTVAEQSSLSDQVVRQGCRYAVCAGHRCSTWDDSIDMAFLSTHPDFNPPEAQMVMTTWHDNEPFDDIVFFFMNNTSFDQFVAERFLICFVGQNSVVEAEIKRLVEAYQAG